MPGGADADDAGAQNKCFHGRKFGGTCRQLKEKLNLTRNHQPTL
jgi:hypothetical protein